MSLPPELLASLDPDDVAAFLVAADWLIARGDPWGDLINAQCRLEGETDPGAFMRFKKQTEALLKAHRLQWLGAAVTAHWHRGFVERVELDDVALLPKVLASEVGGLARDFALQGRPRELELALELLAQRSPPRLRGVSLAAPPRSREVSAPVRVPALRLARLEVKATRLDWALDGAALRWLSVADTSSPELEAFLGSAGLTQLERLELLQAEVPHPTVQALVDRQPGLRVLHLEDDLPDDLARWLAQSPVLKTLEHLALGGPLTDDGLDALLKSFARFSRLQSIVLYGGRFGATARKWTYKQLPRLVFERHRPGPSWPGHPRHGIRASPASGS